MTLLYLISASKPATRDRASVNRPRSVLERTSTNIASRASGSENHFLHASDNDVYIPDFIEVVARSSTFISAGSSELLVPKIINCQL